MLDIFKQQKSFLTRAKEKSSFKYILHFDEVGAYIEVSDNKLKPINNIDFRVYNGIDREILQLLEKLSEEDFFEISWEDESSFIYLHRYPRLLELLRLSDKLYSSDNICISFQDGISIINYNIIPKNDKLVVYPSLDRENDFRFLSDDYIISKNSITQIESIGENFNRLNNFDTIIEEDKVEEILTILMTHFKNINIVYGDYDTIYKDEKKLIKPAVLFEKVTVDNELILQTSATIGKLSPQFFNDFNITKIVLLNELEKSISVYECDFADVFEIYASIFKTLSSLKRTIQSDHSSFSEEDGLFIIEGDLANEFILQNLHTIITKCEVFGSDKLKAYKYSTLKPTLNISFKDKIDFLDGDDVSVSIGEEQFNIFDMINLYNKHSYIPLKNGEKSILDRAYISKLERIFKKDGKKIKVSFFDLPEIESLIAQKSQKVFVNSRKFYEGFNKLKKSRTSMPKLQDVTFRDYQKQGVRWLKYLYDNEFGGCLADDMGLGKTLQAIALLSYIYPKTKAPSLIVMPRSLLTNWQNEIKRFNPNLSFYLYYANERDEKKIREHNIVLTTYAMVRNDIKKLQEIEFDTIILDESQNIKNIDSKISKAVMLLESKHQFALSGTPIENSLSELYSLFRFINNGMFSSASNFKKDFALPIQTEGDEEISKVLKAKISPFLLRRLKSDVLKDLPAKQEQVIYVDMEDEHKRFYNKRRDYYKQLLDTQIDTNGIEKSKFIILQAFNDLRQIASAPELKSENHINSSKIDNMSLTRLKRIKSRINKVIPKLESRKNLSAEKKVEIVSAVDALNQVITERIIKLKLENQTMDNDTLSIL